MLTHQHFNTSLISGIEALFARQNYNITQIHMSVCVLQFFFLYAIIENTILPILTIAVTKQTVVIVH